jgi:ATP-dependent DNA helicase RecG
MLKLSSPVNALPKIGPKFKKSLEKLTIFSIEDLLYHFPFRYDDFSEVKKIKDLIPNEIATVLVTLGPVQNIFTKYRKRLTKAKIVDHTGDIDVTWFNQHYIKDTLKVGKTYYFSGKTQLFNNKLAFVAPEFEEKKEDNVNTARLVPIYPETLGISSKWLRNKIHNILKSETDLDEFLPKELLKEQKLKDIKWSLEQIHFPESIEEAGMARERLAFEELFMELLNVEKRKHEWSVDQKGHKMAKKETKIKTFLEGIPFELTASQKQAVNDIIEDLQKEHPMNRLLEGDVGTGKTIVALIAAYFTHLNGLRTLYMAPTEILAGQHFETFKKFFENMGIKIGLATSNKKIEVDDFDIIIGTHALIFKPEKYRDVGFIVVDEQHRFGVEQRGKILEMTEGKNTPHLLTMTATPIPRTLALTLYGDLSISALKTHPNKLRKITTKVIKGTQRDEAYNWVKEKMEPAFIVCPLIEESDHETMENVKAAEAEYEKLKNGIFSDIPIGLLHGRMRSNEKDEVVEKFRKGEIKVLVSTPVIEVGIDVPDATVIIIESAERYGLASLHQLRGRVGRGEKEGFCFIFMTSRSKDAYTRLKYLENINNGLELAEIDMKLRGQGDVFGTMQSGFKRFKIAKLENLEMLETAKLEAQKYFKLIDEYPLLNDKLRERVGDYIINN